MESSEGRLVDSGALPRPGARDWYKLHGTTEKRAFGADPADPRNKTLAPSRRLVMSRGMLLAGGPPLPRQRLSCGRPGELACWRASGCCSLQLYGTCGGPAVIIYYFSSAEARLRCRAPLLEVRCHYPGNACRVRARRETACARPDNKLTATQVRVYLGRAS